MRERKYVKFRVDMYEDTKFKIIDRMPKRDLIYYVWSRIVLLAGKVNQDGDLYMSKNIPYTVETLAIEFNRNIDEIKIALDAFMELEMIEFIENKFYRVINFAKHQNIKVKEKVEIKKEENNIAENGDETVRDSENDEKKEVNFEEKIPTVEREEADSKINRNATVPILDVINTNLDNKNKCDDKRNEDKKNDEKNNISQHNNSPVILEMKKNPNLGKKNKKISNKRIKDDIIETNNDDDGLSCWITEEDLKPKEGEKVLLEMSF